MGAGDRLLAEAVRTYISGEPARAEALCSAILDREPDHIEALLCNAMIALGDGRKIQGAALLRRVIELEFPGAGAADGADGALAAIAEGDSAVAAFYRGVILRPNDAALHVTLGEALGQLGRLAEAETAIRRAIALNPRMVQAYVALGIVLARLERPDETADAFRAAVTLAPGEAMRHIDEAFRTMAAKAR
jgi:tetratricopeptide (TPR) repeat protein